MAIGSKELAPVELDTFEDARLTDELKKAKEELFNLRFQSATGQLESHGRIRAVKRDIARIYTVLRERELGIRATPVVEVATATKAPAKRSTKKTEDVAAAPAEDTTTDSAEEASK
jgi:large subunit ribosomal protein L29